MNEQQTIKDKIKQCETVINSPYARTELKNVFKSRLLRELKKLRELNQLTK